MVPESGEAVALVDGSEREHAAETGLAPALSCFDACGPQWNLARLTGLDPETIRKGRREIERK